MDTKRLRQALPRLLTEKTKERAGAIFLEGFKDEAHRVVRELCETKSNIRVNAIRAVSRARGYMLPEERTEIEKIALKHVVDANNELYELALSYCERNDLLDDAIALCTSAGDEKRADAYRTILGLS